MVVLAVIAACAAGAAALSVARGDEYESTAVVSGGSGSLEAARSVQLARRALDAAGARAAPAQALLDHSEVEREPGGELSFTVRADEPAAARMLAGSYARASVDALPERESARTSPAGPAERTGGVLRAVITGAGVGLLAGLLLALVREALDVRRTSSRTIGTRLGSKELGHVPALPAAVEQAYRVAALEDPDGAVAVAYGLVAANLAEEAERASARVVMVAGTVAEDHGEQVAANLAVSLAAAGRRVAIVEIDLDRPLLRRLFALERGPGLGEVLRDEVPLEDALARVPGVESLVVLTAGIAAPVAPPPDALLDALARTCELVIVCGPPLLRRGRVPLPRADRLVLAVNLHRVRHSRWPRLERLLRALDVPVLGFVLVGARDSTAVLPAPPERVAAD